MHEGTMEAVSFPEVSAEDALTGILRAGATRLLGQAIAAEVAAYIAAHADLRDTHGCRLVVRNGHKDEREIQAGQSHPKNGTRFLARKRGCAQMTECPFIGSTHVPERAGRGRAI